MSKKRRFDEVSVWRQMAGVVIFTVVISLIILATY